MITTPILQKIYELVGEATSNWNRVELLWYLLFTGLMHPTDRAKTDVIFAQLQTGAMQRQVIVALAQTTLVFDVRELKNRNPEHHARRRILRMLGKLNSTTNAVAGRRNAVVHAAFEPWTFDRVMAFSSGPKISKLRDEDHLRYLTELIEDIALLAHDLDELREMIIDWLTPEDQANKKVREASMRDAGFPPPADARKKAQEELRAVVSQRTPRPPQPSP